MIKTEEEQVKEDRNVSDQQATKDEKVGVGTEESEWGTREYYANESVLRGCRYTFISAFFII